MNAIKIKITKFITDDQPGFVECTFADAWGRQHTIQDKVPIVTDKFLDAPSDYPQDGIVACEIIREWEDKDGRTIFTVTTAKPWGVDTIDGVKQFDMPVHQVVER